MSISKNRLNFWVDLLMFVDMLLITLIGLVMYYVLPPGSGGRHGGWGLEVKSTFLGMSRHEWGDVHFIMALLLLAMLVLHIVLHWKWIVHQFKCTFRGKTKEPDSSCDTDS